MDVQVSGADDAVTVGHLFAAAGLGFTDGPVDVDGRRCDATTPLSAIDPADGAVILRRVRHPLESGDAVGDVAIGPVSGEGIPGSPLWLDGEVPVARLISVAGPGAGRSRELEPGTWDLCIVPAVALPSPRGVNMGTAMVRVEVAPDGTVRFGGIGHTSALIDGVVADEDLRSGSWVAVDQSVFRVEPIGRTIPPPAATGGGRTDFIRAPRVFQGERVEPVLAPALPPEPREPEPLSWLLLLLPLPIGIVMALLFSPFFLMFSLLSPITAVGRNYDGKRRKRKALVDNADAMRKDLLRFIDQLDQRRAAAAAQRRAARPDLAELVAIARTGDPTLWRVRSSHADFLRPIVGVGPVAWEPEIIGDLVTPEMKAAVAAASTLPMSPYSVDLRDGLAVGIVGLPEARRAMAATLVSNLVAEHGPGDVILAAFLDEHSARFWDHLKWLPHLVDETGGLRVSTSPEEAEAQAANLLTEPEKQAFLASRQDEIETPVPVVLVDADAVVRGGVRPLAARFPRMAGRAIVLADTVEALPSFCTSYCAIDSRTGTVEVIDVGSGRRVDGVIGAFSHRDTMVDLSRSLARFVDPDSRTRAASLPDYALLTELLGVEPNGERLQASWADPPAGCLSLLGAAEDGPLEVEFIRDGPHALVAGTTGAGKSELLRTMIVSLAARYGPDRVTFVLVDFKGGGAFDVFADLPHNVGVVTDLDEHLSARALRCLQAELKHRELRLRDAGVSNVTELPEDAEPLPRLLIVVDEFATLAAELPDFMASLIDVAQRGRSLGIHMVLATQRPTGVVDAKIRANTNLRIALRVQDDGDSTDVIGGKAAAEIDRRHPGRAFARFGASELIGFQTALVSVATGDKTGPALHLDTFELTTPAVGPDGPSFDFEGPDDLARYVEAARDAQAALGLADPRVPWPDPLPLDLAVEDLLDLVDERTDTGGPANDSPQPFDRPWAAPFGLIDLPDDQCQIPAWWSPNDGNLVFYGIEPGAAASAVATVVFGLAHRHDADHFHVYVLDFAGSLAALQQLPHAGGYVNADDDERLLRTIQLLEVELDRRRRLIEAARIERLEATTDLGEPTPLLVVAVANYGGVLELFEELGELTGANRLAQIVRDGPALGLFVFIASSSERDVPNRVGQQIEAKYVMRMADPNAYLMFGLKTKEVPELVPGRAIDTRNKQELQIARVGGGDLRHAIESVEWAVGNRGPTVVPILGSEIDVDRVASASSATDTIWHLSIGLSADDLTPVGLDLRSGRHALITGPSGAGKTTVLQTIASVARYTDPDALIALATSRPEEWRDLEPTLGLVTLDYLLSSDSDDDVGRRTLIVVDGFETLDLPDEALEHAAARPPGGLHLVVSGRPDGFRMPAPWIRSVMSHRTGVAVNAAPEHGDLFRCRFPMLKAAVPAGRGYIINEGIAVPTQIARSQSVSMTDPPCQAAEAASSTQAP